MNTPAKLIVAMMLISTVYSGPLPANFQCAEAKEAGKLFRSFLSANRAADLSSTLRLSLRYFNVSEVYYEPMYTMITSYCKPKTSGASDFARKKSR